MPARKLFICLCAGIFFASASFGQAQRLVLFEEFSSEDCPSCDSVNPYVHTLTRLCPNKVVGISYQSYIPTPGPLYYQDQSDVQNRLQYYGVTSSPWGQQDGALWDSSLVTGTGNNPLSWCTYSGTLASDSAYLDTEYVKPSPFAITVTHSFTATTDSFYASVIITGADSFTVSSPGKLSLRVAMVEDLQYAIPPGTNGETGFPHVVRHMYPDAIGTNLVNSWDSGQTQTFNFSGLVPSSIQDKTRVRFLAFIQDDNNLHVQQAGLSAPFTFTLDAAVENIQGNFIQCSTSYSPVFTFVNYGSSTITGCSFQINDNGTGVSTQTWSGNLLPGDSTIITLASVTLNEGTHALAITAQNPNNSTDGNPGNNTVTINIGVSLTAPLATPVIQGFENATADSGWLAESVEHIAYGWSRQNVGDSSNYGYQMDFWDVPGGYVSNLYTPPFTLAGSLGGRINFDRAYAQEDFGRTGGGPDVFSLDSLYIEVSADCGDTWQNVYSNGAGGMATAPEDSADPFIPTQSQWVADMADLSIVAGNPEVLLRFKAVSGNGNELYIDNVHIARLQPEDVESLKNVNSFQLYPNPADGFLNITWQPGNWPEASYKIEDMTGRVVISGPVDVKDTGQPGFTIGTSALTSGLYLFTFTSRGENKSRPFCVTH